MQENGRRGSRQSQLKDIMPSDLLQRVADANDQVLTVDDLAEMLNVTRSAIYKRIVRGNIKGVCREGRFLYILKSDYIRQLREKKR